MLMRKLFAKKSFTHAARTFSSLSSLQPYIQLGKQYPGVGQITINGRAAGSCVLVQDKIILTARHCVPPLQLADKYKIGVAFEGAEISAVKDVLIHPEDDNKTACHDMAVLLLENS